jgi:hypothetical protein
MRWTGDVVTAVPFTGPAGFGYNARDGLFFSSPFALNAVLALTSPPPVAFTFLLPFLYSSPALALFIA